MTYFKEANEKLTNELTKWEQRQADIKKNKLDLGEEEDALSNTYVFSQTKIKKLYC